MMDMVATVLTGHHMETLSGFHYEIKSWSGGPNKSFPIIKFESYYLGVSERIRLITTLMK